MSEQGHDAQHKDHGSAGGAPGPSRTVITNEERRRILHAVSERSFCEPVDSGNWDARHVLTFTNDGLNPNYRSYFDRHLDYREPGSDALGPLKPSWRLTSDSVDQGERQEMRLARQWFSSCHIPSGSTAAGPVDQQSTGRALFIGSQPALERRPPLPQEPPSQLRRDAKRPKPGGGGECHSRLSGAEPSPADMFSADPDVLASVAKRDSVENWNAHHHVTWSNEKSVGSKLLNPVQTRNYFDRLRTPAPGQRSVQIRSTSEGQDSLSTTMHSIRAVPVWRLNASQEGITRSLDGTLSNTESVVERPRSLTSHTGTGGGLWPRRSASETMLPSLASVRKNTPSPKKSTGSASGTGQVNVLMSRSFAMCLSAPPPREKVVRGQSAAAST